MPPRSESAIATRDPAVYPDARDVAAKLSMSDLRTRIPKECFKKSLPKSLFYMVRDMGAILVLQQLYPYVVDSWALTIVWANAVGFMMWALFVVGHDCGHGTFSDYPWVNGLFGHLCHAPLLVPFWPWAKSHSEHHKYHNHVHKDMSFPWLGLDQQNEQWAITRWILASPLHPFISFGLMYLTVGYWDGSHFNPMGPLFWNRRERVQAAVSGASVAVFLYLLVEVVFQRDWPALAVRYLLPWAIYNYWLVMVTYMQHHSPETKTFDSNDFHFATAAMETIDRKYGWGLDGIHHNITDGHVTHHLFFTKIPHYNLARATSALRPHLESLGVYQFENNPLFLWDFWKSNSSLGFHTHSKNKSHRAHLIGPGYGAPADPKGAKSQ